MQRAAEIWSHEKVLGERAQADWLIEAEMPESSRR
jgi:hypothetical protein